MRKHYPSRNFITGYDQDQKLVHIQQTPSLRKRIVSRNRVCSSPYRSKSNSMIQYLVPPPIPIKTHTNFRSRLKPAPLSKTQCYEDLSFVYNQITKTTKTEDMEERQLSIENLFVLRKFKQTLRDRQKRVPRIVLRALREDQ